MKGKYQYISLVLSKYSHNDEPRDRISSKLRPSTDIYWRRKEKILLQVQNDSTLKKSLGK